MADTKISSYPWLCSTLSGYHDDCYSDAQGLVSDQDAAEQDIATEDAYGKYGLKLVYYAVSKDLERDQLFAEDQLRWILRSWYFIGYTNSIPPNVRSYQLQGIWGEDMMTLYVGKGSFKYYSKYGGPDKNTPDVYDTWEPKIDDIIYPIVMAERFARNYKELSPEMIICIKNAIKQFDELPKKSFDFTNEDFDEFNSDVNEAKALIAYINKLYN